VTSKKSVRYQPIKDFSLWKKIEGQRIPTAFELEITARCNLNCRHCYINLPANDSQARREELTLEEIGRLADEAVSLGAIWCLITGGEPLLREDFSEIYLLLKKKGLLVSVFTNATLIREAHIKLFKKYPPRDIEVTVYGVTPETFQRVTRRPTAFKLFQKGLKLLLENGIPVRLKAMALRSNVKELEKIRNFCQSRTKDYFRFDPFLHLRYDRDEKRNKEIEAERLTPEEITLLERQDKARFQQLKKDCQRLILKGQPEERRHYLFKCGAGFNNFSLSYNGLFRLCSSLWHSRCLYNWRQGSLSEAWNNFVPKIRAMESQAEEFINNCDQCPIINFCLWCPAHADLELGRLDQPVEYFCQVAHERLKNLK
jgi:radical SAM protein with 4Fe4S-binding SPASM domain